jgi:hypothetical protein
MTKPDNTRFLEQANAQRRQATLAALLDLGRFLEHHTEPALLLGPDGERAPLPEEVYRVVVEVVEAMRGARSSRSSRAPSG